MQKIIKQLAYVISFIPMTAFTSAAANSEAEIAIARFCHTIGGVAEQIIERRDTGWTIQEQLESILDHYDSDVLEESAVGWVWMAYQPEQTNFTPAAAYGEVYTHCMSNSPRDN